MFAISDFFQFLKKEPSLFGMYQEFSSDSADPLSCDV
jgi:hypothetical protein